jgi:CheY-like chemotaxis protein
MKKKITPLMAFGILWLLVIIISWNAFPGWRKMDGGIWILFGATAVGIVAFLKDSISFMKTWLETLSLQDSQPVLDQAAEDDSRVTNIPWEARDRKLAEKYFDLSRDSGYKFDKHVKENKQIEFFLSFGLLKKVKDKMFFTQAGVLLFCKQDKFPHAILHTEIVVRYDTQQYNIERKKDFSGPILETYFQIYEILKPLIAFREVEGKAFYYPDIAIKEALVNFLIHRDYLQDAIAYITVYDDRVEFYNPGSSIFTVQELLTVAEALQLSYRRNPRLIQALKKTGLNHNEGRGILCIKDALWDSYGNQQNHMGLLIENDNKMFRLTIYKISLTPRRASGGRARILYFEDDEAIGNMVKLYFSGMGIDVDVTGRGFDALKRAKKVLPHLIILDIMLTDIDGYEVCRILRTSTRTSHIPVIFLTVKDERSDKLQGLELGADDYITKPFDIDELKLRVLGAIRRAERENLTDPRSGLPAGRLIEKQLRRIIREKGWALLDIGINHFEPFKNVYGFVAGDDVLRFTAMLISEVVDELGATSDFIGHAKEDNFIIITKEEKAEAIKTRLKERFSSEVQSHYNFLDREQGFIRIPKTDHSIEIVPLMALAVGIVSWKTHLFADIREITEFSAESLRYDATHADDE